MKRPSATYNISSLKGIRARTIISFRWGAILGQILCLFIVHFWLKFDIAFWPCLALILISILFNFYLIKQSQQTTRLNIEQTSLVLLFDIAQLGLLLYLTGGLVNPFTLLFIAPITIAATTLPAKRTISLGILIGLTLTGLTHYHMPLPWYQGYIFDLPLLYQFGIWIAIITAGAFIGVYVWRLVKETENLANALTATEMILAREQKLSAIDGLAAAAAHGFGTPLSTILMTAKELERSIKEDSPHLEDIRLIRTEAIRCRGLLQSFTEKEDDQDLLTTASPFSQLIEEIIRPHLAIANQIKIDITPKDKLKAPFKKEPVIARHPALIYGLGNLVENAADFANDLVLIKGAWDEDKIELEIIDDGPGFSKEILANIGEPFHSTRPLGGKQLDLTDDWDEADELDENNGMGLGLFISTVLLQRSGAQISFANHKSKKKGATTGAHVRLSWPRDRLDIKLKNH